MSRVLHDYLPDEITAGEQAALADATEKGWIGPPVYCCLRGEPPRPWRTVNLRYLERRGFVAESQRRLDGVLCVRLNAAGLKYRAEMLAYLDRRLAA